MKEVPSGLVDAYETVLGERYDYAQLPSDAGLREGVLGSFLSDKTEVSVSDDLSLYVCGDQCALPGSVGQANIDGHVPSTVMDTVAHVMIMSRDRPDEQIPPETIEILSEDYAERFPNGDELFASAFICATNGCIPYFKKTLDDGEELLKRI